uniref:Uncharacterized protein n=1 Tax=Oryza sativa subsp. japonica TaxID=39947 RepID=Q33B17_ORYSJ|nr:hypothetical protein LOC_Os10g05960 [Oryza sativa Japonica Group]
MPPGKEQQRTSRRIGHSSNASSSSQKSIRGTQIHVPDCYIHKPVYQELLHGDQLRFTHPECFAFLLGFDKLYQQIQDFIFKASLKFDLLLLD